MTPPYVTCQWPIRPFITNKSPQIDRLKGTTIAFSWW